jgi:hypothetical protein
METKMNIAQAEFEERITDTLEKRLMSVMTQVEQQGQELWDDKTMFFFSVSIQQLYYRNLVIVTTCFG